MRSLLLLLLPLLVATPAAAQLPDRDADGVPDEIDNCVDLPNPDQVDSNAGTDDDASLPGIQAYGNVCDPDLDDDGSVDGIDRLFQLGCFRGTPPLGFDCAHADLVGASLEEDPDPAAVSVNAFDRFQMLRWFRTAGSRPGRSPDTYPVAGLSGDLGDDLTLEHLYGLETFESLPGWPRLYFSADPGGLLPEGDDANPCTLEEPCKSASLMEDRLNGHEVIVVLDGADAWDDENDELAGWDGFHLLNTGCGSGADRMEDVPCGFLVPLDPSDAALFDCSGSELVDGSDHPFLKVSGAGSGYFGLAGLVIDHCPQNPGTNGQLQSEYVVWVVARQGRQGAVVLVNVDVRNSVGSHSHAFRAATGHLVAINSRGAGRDLADFNSDCVGATCAGNDPTPQAACAVGQPGVPYDCCDGGSPVARCHGTTHIFEVARGNMTVLSDATMDLVNSQLPPLGAGPACFVSDCIDGEFCQNVVVGMVCRPPPLIRSVGNPSRSGCASNLFPVAGAGLTSFFARILCLAWPAEVPRVYGFHALDNGNGSQNDSAEVTLFQNTVTGADVAVYAKGQFAGDLGTVTGRCNVFDDLRQVAGDALVVEQFGGNLGRIVLDFDGSNVYDSDDGLASFRCNQDEYALASSVVRDGCAVSTSPVQDTDVNADFFGSTAGGSEGPLESGGEGVDGSVFDTSPGASPGDCAAGSECDGTCPHTQLVPLPPSGFVPQTVVGGIITRLELGTHHVDAGAR